MLKAYAIDNVCHEYIDAINRVSSTKTMGSNANEHSIFFSGFTFGIFTVACGACLFSYGRSFLRKQRKQRTKLETEILFAGSVSGGNSSRAGGSGRDDNDSSSSSGSSSEDEIETEGVGSPVNVEDSETEGIEGDEVEDGEIIEESLPGGIPERLRKSAREILETIYSDIESKARKN